MSLTSGRASAPFPKLIFFLSSVVILALDLASKQLVFVYFSEFSSYPLIPGVLQISPTWNSGVAWGMMQWGGKLFLYLLPFLILFLLYYAWKIRAEWKGNIFCMGMVFGGALGNYVDRLCFLRVRDFIDVRLHDFYRFPVFNVADSAISCGVVIMLLHALLRPARPSCQCQEQAPGP